MSTIYTSVTIFQHEKIAKLIIKIHEKVGQIKGWEFQNFSKGCGILLSCMSTILSHLAMHLPNSIIWWATDY